MRRLILLLLFAMALSRLMISFPYGMDRFIYHDIYYSFVVYYIHEIILSASGWVDAVQQLLGLGYTYPPLQSLYTAAGLLLFGASYFHYRLLSLLMCFILYLTLANLDHEQEALGPGLVTAFVVMNFPLVEGLSVQHFYSFQSSIFTLLGLMLTCRVFRGRRQGTPVMAPALLACAALAAAFAIHPVGFLLAVPILAFGGYAVVTAPWSGRTRFAVILAGALILWLGFWTWGLGSLSAYYHHYARDYLTVDAVPARSHGSFLINWFHSEFFIAAGHWVWIYPIGLAAGVFGLVREPDAFRQRHCPVLLAAIAFDFAVGLYTGYAGLGEINFWSLNVLLLYFSVVEIHALAQRIPRGRLQHAGIPRAVLAVLVGVALVQFAWTLRPAHAADAWGYTRGTDPFWDANLLLEAQVVDVLRDVAPGSGAPVLYSIRKCDLEPGSPPSCTPAKSDSNRSLEFDFLLRGLKARRVARADDEKVALPPVNAEPDCVIDVVAVNRNPDRGSLANSRDVVSAYRSAPTGSERLYFRAGFSSGLLHNTPDGNYAIAVIHVREEAAAKPSD